jgi:hypothetical protein
MSKTIYTHKHHIIPKHAGGSNDPSNLIELTLEEHALAHKKLYEEHGRWQDEIAYLTLSGQIGKEEARIRALKKALTGKKQTEEHKRKNREATKGKKHKEESKRKMRKPKSEEHKRNLSKAMKGKKRGPYKKRIIK